MELLCFIKINKIKLLKDIINKKLDEIGGLNEFKKYLKNYIFKLDTNIYNYNKLIEYSINNNNKYLEKLYTTNNICESINSKLNYYLPKKVITVDNFIESISKFIINEDFKEKKYKRNDYITKSLILMINELNLNSNLHWISYDEFIKYQKICINENNYDRDNNSINKIIEYINNSIDSFEANSKESDSNDKNKNEIFMEFSKKSLSDLEDENKSINIDEYNDRTKENVNNNLVELFEELKIKEENLDIIEESDLNNKSINNINGNKIVNDISERLKKPLKERVLGRIILSNNEKKEKDLSKKLYSEDLKNTELSNDKDNKKAIIYPKEKNNNKKLYPKKRKKFELSDEEDNEKNYNYPKDRKIKKRGH